MIYSPHYSETDYGRRKQKRKETEPRRPSACADADLAGQYAVYSGTGILPFQIYVLNNSPLLNKAIMLGIACLWILWFAAKNLIKLLLLLILAGTAVYGYYGYATRDARKCEENGGVWNKESKTCEEKTGWLLEIQKLVEQYLKK